MEDSSKQLAILFGSFLTNAGLASYGVFKSWQNKKLTEQKTALQVKNTVAETEKASSNCEELLKAKQAHLDATLAACDWQKKAADEYKKLYDDLLVRHEKYRQEWHKKNEDVTTLVLNLTAENADLKAQTNLTPILEGQVRMVATQDRITDILVAICKHMEISHEPKSS